MATRYTCDRCGQDAGIGGRTISARTNLSAWKGDGSLAPRIVSLRVVLTFNFDELGGPAGDLCDLCKIDAARKAIFTLNAERGSDDAD